MNFTCTQCHKRYDTKELPSIMEFEQEFPGHDIRKARLVCEKCYTVALRMLQIKKQQEAWINYCMSE